MRGYRPVVIDVDHPRVADRGPGDLVHVLAGGQPGAEVEEPDQFPSQRKHIARQGNRAPLAVVAEFAIVVVLDDLPAMVPAAGQPERGFPGYELPAAPSASSLARVILALHAAGG